MKKSLILILVGAILGSTIAFAASQYFSDVSENTWYSDAVNNLSEKGIINGYPDGTFGPSKNVNRAELAVMLDRLIDYIEPIKTTQMNKTTAVSLLSEAGCFWDTSQENVSVAYEEPNWIIKKEDCLGECRINAFTEDINNDDNPMCMGIDVIDETEAIEILEAADCIWNLSDEGVSIVHEEDNWVIKKSGCLGVCSIDDIGATPAYVDDNPMCMGAE